MSWRWFFRFFRHVSHLHHLPCIQTRAGGGFLGPFYTSATMTTSLASKRKPGGLFSIFHASAMTTTSFTSKHEQEVDFLDVSTCLPPPPPPSCPNMSWRWIFLTFQRISHCHHLPCIQMRAGCGVFTGFNTFAITTTSLASKREPEVNFFNIFNSFATTTTTLASKRELEVVFSTFQCLCHLPHVQMQAGGGSFQHFQPVCHDHHLPRVQMRARGAFFGCFNTTAITTTSHPHNPLPLPPCHHHLQLINHSENG